MTRRCIPYTLRKAVRDSTEACEGVPLAHQNRQHCILGEGQRFISKVMYCWLIEATAALNAIHPILEKFQTSG